MKSARNGGLPKRYTPCSAIAEIKSARQSVAIARRNRQKHDVHWRIDECGDVHSIWLARGFDMSFV